MKIDYKSAYRRGILHFATALKTATQLPDKAAALITLRLTFGGAPCPFQWGVISESICDLANELVQCNDWDPADLHALVQKDIPPPQFLDDDIPFAEGRELIVDILVDPRGKADVYIDDTTGLTVDILVQRTSRGWQPQSPSQSKSQHVPTIPMNQSHARKW
jgi:hypothetical protein